MLAPVRVGLFAALVTLASIFVRSIRRRRRQGLPARRSRRSRDQARSPDQERRRPGRQSRWRSCAARPTPRSSATTSRTGMVLLGQIVAVAPADSANWLRLARAIHADPPGQRPRAHDAARARRDRRLHRLPARQQPQRGGRQPRDHRPHLRRPAASGGRRSMRCGCRSNCARSPTCARSTSSMREDHGFRLLDYSVDADAASPRACFQFSEELPGKRTDFSPFVAVAGIDKPALSAEEKQLCVEGLKHGERYSVTLRAGLPSTVQGDAGEVGRLHDLRARPQAVRALHRQGLRAAAHRPARHPGGQRQHQGGDDRRSTASATAT